VLPDKMARKGGYIAAWSLLWGAVFIIRDFPSDEFFGQD